MSWVRDWLWPRIAHVLSWLRRSLVRWLPAPGAAHRPLSTAWLSRVMGAHVIDATTRPLENSRGLSGELSCVTVTIPDRAGPVYLMLKMTPNTIAARRAVVRSGAIREADFYGSALARQAGAIPQVFYARASSMLAESVVLMEDVRRMHGGVNVNLVFGNQIWGMPEPLQPPRDPALVLRAMFLRAAEIHAPFWRDPALLQQSWLKGVSWFHGKGRDQWESAMRTARDAWASTKAAMPSSGVSWSPRLVRLLDASFAMASWERMQALLRDPSRPFTLCHGDFHASNAFLIGDNTICLYDWSEVGPWEPTTDLAQFIISDVRPEVFREHALPALEAYWARLQELGVRDRHFTLEACKAAFARGAERWVWLLPVLAAFPGMPGVATQYFHDQMLAFVEAFLPSETTFLDLKSVVCI